MDHCTLMVPYDKISAPSKTKTSESKHQFSPIGLHELVVRSHLSKALKYLYRLILVLKGSCLANKEVPKEGFDLRALDRLLTGPIIASQYLLSMSIIPSSFLLTLNDFKAKNCSDFSKNSTISDYRLYYID